MSIDRDLKCKTRQDCIKRWIEGKGIDPSPELVHVFETGFNMAWKHKPHKVFVDRDGVISELLKSKRIQ